jgi:hypothetical protein
MKNKNIVIGLSGVLALIAAVETTTPVFAHTQHYYVGFADGSHTAFRDYGYGYNPSCPTNDDGSDHTANYCAGYTDGYRAQWHAIYVYHHPQTQSIEQSSNVNIRGNNNRVVVNQQASNNVGERQQGGQSYPYPFYPDRQHSINPRCAILCANIQIR